MKLLKEVAKSLGARKVVDAFDRYRSAIKGYNRRLQDSRRWREKIGEIKNRTGSAKLHLGCGNNRIPNMVNCEYRNTPAADLVMDCSDLSRFGDSSIDHIFSHAFFEHLYFDQRQPLLAACRRVLKRNCTLLFIGLPDLKIIAESYLKKAELAPGWGFDAYMVYRYTHGSPEIADGWWLEQLHKTLFDRDVVRSLLEGAGFDHWVIFNYRFVGEDIPLNLGFAAWNGDMTSVNLEELLAPHADKIASLEEVKATAEFV